MNTRVSIGLAGLFFVAAFSLAARVEPWFQTWEGSTLRRGGMMQALLGDGRRMFANQLFVKADVYFHNGYYPTIFDNNEAFATVHVAADAGAMEEKNTGDIATFLGPPRDWLDAFGRMFFPSQHTHLDAGDLSEHGHTHNHAGAEGEASAEAVAEIMPWLRMSVDLDPNHVESYMVAAFWLRERMHRMDDAEQFLREGLRANPNSYELLYEMGRLLYDGRHDAERARQMWFLALQRWGKQESGKADPDVFMLRSILSELSKLEENEGNFDVARQYLVNAGKTSRDPNLYTQRIAEIDARQKAASSAQSRNPPQP